MSLAGNQLSDCQYFSGILINPPLRLSLFILSKTVTFNKKLKTLARSLRKNGTMGEAILWRDVLSRKRFYGYQFNRQFLIQNFIVDFICRKLKLVIEVDGSLHQDKS